MRCQIESAREASRILSFAGIYDVFSATIASPYADGVFVSGFGFAASHYGLPDIGFNAWPDVVNFVQRIRAVLSSTPILVDIDDGFCDVEVACHMVRLLESVGASGVVLEDQARPRRCGHVAGKQILPLDEYMSKLERVLRSRHRLGVIARTDATDRREILRRVAAFSQTDADAILVDGIADLSLLEEIRATTTKPLVFNQIVGGTRWDLSLDDMRDVGVTVAIFSTPCLFAAQAAIQETMCRLSQSGRLSVGGADLQDCNRVLTKNLGCRQQDRTNNCLQAPVRS